MSSLDIKICVARALQEDLGTGDVTTNPIVSTEATVGGRIIAKQNGVIAGLDVAATAFSLLDPAFFLKPGVAEGSYVERGTTVAEIHGNARAVLSAERTALNFLGRMSGIATLTKSFVDEVAGTKAIILDTRKTAPGLRLTDKYAVLRGGAQNHRHGLYDMVLIKDNHIAYAGSIARAVEQVRAANTRLAIEVEARTLEDVKAAIELRVERILLDNMEVDEMEKAVKLADGRTKLEASGNVTLATVRSIAETGVDFISVGELTHSARVFDVSLDLQASGR